MTRRITLAIVAALTALLLATGLAAAQDPPETATATRLEPGLNLVGWVGEPTPVSQLFQQIPQLEAIWAWDAELHDWIVAAPGAPEWLGGLGRVTAGMGLRMQLGGDEPYLWQRSTEPTRGLVKLRTGWNLVAWSGADGAAIGDVVKGIGWSLRTVRRWDATNQQWEVWTSPERSAQVIANTDANQDADNDAQTPGIRRGEALWIEVARAVNWLQPTEILPRLVFPGGASQELQTRVREDLQATLSFFRDQYGIQADPDFTIYVAKDVDALIQAYKDDGHDARAASIRALWNLVGGWAGRNVVVKQASWPEDLSDGEIARGRYTITHEYFHILQDELSDTNSWATGNAWLTEGTASWVEDEHAVFDGQRTWDDFRNGIQSVITNDTPTLRSAEDDNGVWHYTLGQLATDQLTASGGPDSLVEFWRALASTEIGPHQRWTSRLDWRAALHQVFGQTVPGFYADFGAWQREQAAANAASSSPYEYDGDWIRGRVTGNDGAPVAGVFVNAIRVEGEATVGWNQRAETGDDGSFAVRAPEDGDYRLSVNIAGDCSRYYSDGQLIDDRAEAHPVAVASADVHDIGIQLPPNVCSWQIRGRIVGPNTEPLAGIPISAYPTRVSKWGERPLLSTSSADGSFAITVDESDEYHIHADLGDGCRVYFRSAGSTLKQDNASRITVSEAHVSDILIQIPEDLCRVRVVGTLNGIERFLDGHVRIDLCHMGDAGYCVSNTRRLLEADEAFAVTAPASGAHRLSYYLDGCAVHYGPTGLTANATDAALIYVDSRDVRVGHRQIPANVCAYEISGALSGVDSQPLANTQILGCLEGDGDCVGHHFNLSTDDDGVFAVTVPVDGAYRLWFNLEGCTVYFRTGGLTAKEGEHSTFIVAGRSLRLTPRKVPTDVCGNRISGWLVDSSGSPLADTRMYALDHGAYSYTRTGPDGGFTIWVPYDGAYAFGFYLPSNCNSRYNNYWLPDGQNNPLRVSGDDVTGVVLRLPATIEELCR